MPEVATAPDNSITPAAPEAAPAASPESAPAVTPPTGVDPRTHLENPLLKEVAVEPEPGSTPPGGEPPEPAAEPGGEPKLLAGKFESPEKLEEAYTALEAKLGTQGSEIGELRRQQQEFNSLREQLIEASQQPAPEPGQQEPQTVEELITEHFGEWDEDKQSAFMDDLYANGMGTIAKELAPIIGKVADSIRAELGQAVEPLIQERQFNEQVSQAGNAISAFGEAHPDMDALKPVMQEAFQADPEFYDSLPPQKAIEMLYNAAKAQSIESAQNAPTLDDFLADPDAQAKFAQSDAVKQLVIAQHAKAIKEGAPPTVIGSQPSGQPPATARTEIKSTKDAGKALLAKLGLR